MYAVPLQTLSDLDRNLDLLESEIDLSLSPYRGDIHLCFEKAAFRNETKHLLPKCAWRSTGGGVWRQVGGVGILLKIFIYNIFVKMHVRGRLSRSEVDNMHVWLCFSPARK